MSTPFSGPSQSLREHSCSGKSHPEALTGLELLYQTTRLVIFRNLRGASSGFCGRFCLCLRDGIEQGLGIAWAFNENGLIADRQNRPLSALILNLGGRPHRTRQKRAQEGSRPRSSAIPPKPRSCPESPVSPIIGAGREMISGKRGS